MKNIAAVALVCALSFPAVALAQDAEQLRATIRAEITKDPRSSALSESQIDAIVESLAQEAQEQGVTPYDILWRPGVQAEDETPQEISGDGCGGMPQLLCNMNRAFGLDGSNTVVPIVLGLCALVLIFIFVELIMHHRKKSTG